MTNRLLHNIYLYNPTCEYAIANGNPNWQPNRLLQKMESDLSVLPLYFAGKTDFVLVDKIPSSAFIDSLLNINIEIPDFILKNDAVNNQQFLNLPKNKLLPWGWSPAAHKFLLPFKQSCSVEFRQSPVFNWKPEHHQITSRKFAANILQQLQGTCPKFYMLPPELAPKICTAQNDFEKSIDDWGDIMIKAPWSSSGRGLQPVTKTPVHPKVWEKVMGIVNQQGYALAEPLLNKAIDLAFLFELKKGTVEFLGASNFYTNKKGQYEGNYLNGLPLTTKMEIVEFVNFVGQEIPESLINVIKNSEMPMYYEGVFGVDTLIYSDKNNNLKINPCLEINVRHTMGLIALRIENLIYQKRKGVFRIFYQPGISFFTFKNEMEKRYPLKITGGKIESGFFALTEAAEDNLFGAYIVV